MQPCDRFPPLCLLPHSAPIISAALCQSLINTCLFALFLFLLHRTKAENHAAYQQHFLYFPIPSFSRKQRQANFHTPSFFIIVTSQWTRFSFSSALYCCSQGRFAFVWLLPKKKKAICSLFLSIFSALKWTSACLSSVLCPPLYSLGHRKAQYKTQNRRPVKSSSWLKYDKNLCKTVWGPAGNVCKINSLEQDVGRDIIKGQIILGLEEW